MRVFLFNILFLFAFFGFILFAVPISYKLIQISQNFKNSGLNYDYRSELENYKNVDWAKQHFHEISRLQTKYFDFIGWRREDFKGSTINIKNGLRQSSFNNKFKEKEIWFFGGSTMWGTGVSDQYTIPSIFSSKTEIYTINYGESAWFSRQSYSMLFNNYIHNSNKRKIIIFYDGVNEVYHRCRSENKGMNTNRQNQIREKLKNYDLFSFSYLTRPLISFSNLIFAKLNIKNSKINSGKFYDCHIDKIKAKKIANDLIEIWSNANLLAQKNGDDFVAVLQPVSFLNQPINLNIDNLDQKWPGLQSQYEIVYNEILKVIDKDIDFSFLNLSEVFNNKNSNYIDFCHLDHNGNKIISNEIINFLKLKNLL